MNLPQDYKPYIDKYFLRAKEILQKDELNPVVKVQVFIRKGNCKVYGIEEATQILTKYSDIEKTGHLYTLLEGSSIENCETVMVIEAPIQSIVDLETMYLGVISAESTLQNDKKDIDLKQIEENMRNIVQLVEGRPISYFGARHWRYDRDKEIADACFRGGATNCSTDIGGSNVNQKGIGTIPHILETIYHHELDLESAVAAATNAFDRHIDKAVPRIALVDYANAEIRDTLHSMTSVDDSIKGIRIDTCGENWMQGVMPISDANRGVSVLGVWILRTLLNSFKEGREVQIILSSGFGNPKKVQEFINYEKITGIKLFDGLGVGGVYDCRMATGDCIEVDGKEIHKVGRIPKVNNKLVKIF